MKINRRVMLVALTVALTVMLAVSVITTLAGSMSTGNLLVNGDFEHGFTAQNGCGMVGNNWGCFQNGGKAGYGFYDDAWERVVAGGSHAQLIEINSKQDSVEQNRTAGIFQTVNVVPGATYDLSFQALIRANDLDSGGDPWRYVMQVGYTHNGSTNWQDASWQEIDAGPIQDRVDPSGYHPVNLKVTAQGHQLTVFIAGVMKWGDWNKEVDFNIDEVILTGAIPKPVPHPEHPIVVPLPEQPTEVVVGTELVCDGPNLLWNGDFEDGFETNGVGYYWWPYNNGGAANYGYYDDMWPPVVASGEHAQLLEINSKGWMPADPQRWIGITQDAFVEPGATYQLSLKTMIREAADHSDEESHRYEVYWGYQSHSAGAHPIEPAISDIGELDSLYGVPVSDISLRTAPGAYTSYSKTFQASDEVMWFYLLGLKKWATEEREVDFDFDDVQLRKCHTVEITDEVVMPYNGMGHPQYDHGHGTDVCTYIVMRGDTLSGIAQMYNTTVQTLVATNNIQNPSQIYVMQPIQVPCGGSGHPYAPLEMWDTDHSQAPTDNDGNYASVEPDQPQKSAIGDQTGTSTSATRDPSDKPASASRGDGTGATRDPAPDDTQQESDVVGAQSQAKSGVSGVSQVHVVKQGEFLGQIAQRYDTTVKELSNLNRIDNPSLIRPGLAIVIPTND